MTIKTMSSEEKNHGAETGKFISQRELELPGSVFSQKVRSLIAEEQRAENPDRFEDENCRSEALLELISKVIVEDGKLFLERRDFYDQGVGDLLFYYFKDNVYDAVRSLDDAVELPGGLNIWDVVNLHKEFFDDSHIRLRAAEWVVKITGKFPVELNTTDFSKHGLGTLISYYRYQNFKNPVYEIAVMLSETNDKGEKLMPWEMENAKDIFEDAETRTEYVGWLLRKAGKSDSSTLDRGDFESFNGDPLLRGRYGSMKHIIAEYESTVGASNPESKHPDDSHKTKK